MHALTRSASLTDYEHVARSVGLDPKQMMRKARLPLACLDKPDTPIAVAGLRRLLELSAKASGAEDFGLRLAERGGLMVHDNGRIETVGPLSARPRIRIPGAAT